MESKLTLKRSIVLFFAISIVVVTSASFLIFSYWENQRRVSQTTEMVREQIVLIVNEFESHRIISFSDFISRNIYDLDKVDKLQVFDQDCNLISSRPLNLRREWNCDGINIPQGMILVELTDVYSDSEGSPRYLLAGLDFTSNQLIGSVYAIPFVIFLILILITLAILYYMINKRIIEPLDTISESVESLDSFRLRSSIKKPLPPELQRILNKVIEKNNSLVKARKQIQRYSQSEAKFIIGRKVAHDMRSPLAILKQHFHYDGKIPRDEVLVHLAIQSIDGTISTLLNNDDISVESVSINTFLESAIRAKKNERGDELHDWEIVLEPLEVDYRVKIDPKVFYPVVSNILNNSIEATRSSKNPKISIKVSELDKRVRITFTDNGVGIEDRKLKSIFEEGYSDGKPNGYGYGLSNAAATVKKHGGSIVANSKKGEWTEITITV